MRQQRSHDLKARIACYEEGGLVLVKDHRRKKGLSPKLQRLWTGPFVVSKVWARPSAGSGKLKGWGAASRQLKPYSGLEVPMWATRFRATLKLGGDRAPERVEDEPGDGQGAPSREGPRVGADGVPHLGGRSWPPTSTARCHARHGAAAPEDAYHQACDRGERTTRRGRRVNMPSPVSHPLSVRLHVMTKNLLSLQGNERLGLPTPAGQWPGDRLQDDSCEQPAKPTPTAGRKQELASQHHHGVGGPRGIL